MTVSFLTRGTGGSAEQVGCVQPSKEPCLNSVVLTISLIRSFQTLELGEINASEK